MKALVIYYDGSDTKAKLVETEIADSSAPHVFGLPDDHDVLAVITGIQFAEDLTVYIDEEEVNLAPSEPDENQGEMFKEPADGATET